MQPCILQTLQCGIRLGSGVTQTASRSNSTFASSAFMLVGSCELSLPVDPQLAAARPLYPLPHATFMQRAPRLDGTRAAFPSHTEPPPPTPLATFGAFQSTLTQAGSGHNLKRIMCLGGTRIIPFSGKKNWNPADGSKYVALSKKNQVETTSSHDPRHPPKN